MKKILGLGKDDKPSGTFENRQVILKFKLRDGERYKTVDDVDTELLFPEGWWEEENLAETEQRIREELGGGIWLVEERRDGKIVKRRTFRIFDTRITYPVVEYRVKIKRTRNSRLYQTDVTFQHFPSEKELVDAVGGGGIFKVEGLDAQGRVVSQDWIEVTDVEPPQWLIEREESLERKLKEKLEEQKRKLEEEVLSRIAGEAKGDPVDAVIEEIHRLIQDEKLRMLKETMETLKGEKKGESIFDVLFIEPHKTKTETIAYIARKLADQGRPEEAAKLLTQNVADGGEALVGLVGAAAALMQAGAIYLAKRAGVDESKLFRERKKKVEEKKVEEKKEEPKPETELKMNVSRIPGQAFSIQIE